MKIAYLDCFSGVSGDMCLGALIDAGLDFSLLEKGLKDLDLPGYTMTCEKVVKQGLSATKVNVHITGSEQHHHRKLADITALLQGSLLPKPVKGNACRVFEMLAQAEARVHGLPVEAVHLHEVGAIDALVDITGTVLGLHLLGVTGLYASPLPLGGGTVHCEHGVLPVPAPATLELLKALPAVPGPAQAELVTPTGAALVAALALNVGTPPAMKVEAAGYGAGTKDFSHPNVLRIIIGETAEKNSGFFSADTVAVVETTIDDMNPELFSSLGEMLFSSGALEYFATPVYMKKNRPGTAVTVLCSVENANRMAHTLLQETTSLGCRIRHEQRIKADRQFITVATPYGEVEVKYSAGTSTIAPEYAQCRQAATASGVPVKTVYDAAKALAWKVLQGHIHPSGDS